MNRETYFRIIELPKAQVLLQKSWHDDSEDPQIAIVFHRHGARFQMTPTYLNEESRDQVFNEFTPEMAQKLVDDFDLSLPFSDEEE